MDLTQYLTQLTQESKGQYRLYDLGRRIRKLDKQQFQQFESLQIAYPFPYLQHAWLALYLSQPQQMENETLMFLKWPLDEQGKLVPYVRDDLVQRLLQLSKQPLKVDSEIEDPLKDNSFSFNPDDIRRANLHALIQASAHRPASSHYDAVKNYLQAGALNHQTLDQWQGLGMQGIADLAARQQEHSASLQGTLPYLPAQAYLAFAQCLEHQQVNHGIAQLALTRLQLDLQQDHNSVAVEAGLRIVGACFSDELRIQAWQAWLASGYQHDVACLLAFATRNYDDLAFMPEKISEFLVALAQLNADENGQANFAAFIKIVGDLLFIPGIRNLLLNVLRQPDRPEILGHALQALLQSRQG